jgi:uncharacterized membrane protein YgcG
MLMLPCRRLRVLAFAVAILCLAPLARPQSERILDYHSDIRVEEDGSMVVTETIHVESEGKQIRHGIYRDLPTSYTDRLGNRYVVGFDLLDTIRDEAPEGFHLEDLSNGKRIYLGDSRFLIPNGKHTYVLRYATNRQLGFFRDHDELFWNVTGNGWIFPIDRASASVHLPTRIPVDQVRLGGYTGPQGSMSQDLRWESQPDGTFEFSTYGALAPGSGVTILLMWPKGYFAAPTWGDRASAFAGDNHGNAVAIGGWAVLLVYYLVVWFMVGRDPASGVLVPRYEPPANLSPAAIRYLARMGFDNKTFASALLDMAVRGFITIKESGGSYTLRRTNADNRVLTPDEKDVATMLLEGRSEIWLHNENHVVISDAIASLKKWLKAAEQKIYFLTNSKFMIPGVVFSILVLVSAVVLCGPKKLIPGIFLCVWLAFWSIAVAALVGGAFRGWKAVFAGGRFSGTSLLGAVIITVFAVPFFLGELFGLSMLAVTTSVFIAATLLLCAFLHVLFHYLLKAPTRAGRAILDKIEGFKMFLGAVDGDRLNRVMPPEQTPETFEKFLPYALALDLEQAWAQKFSGLLDGASHGPGSNGYSPTWCAGAGWSTLGAAGLASSWSDSFTSAISSSAAAPGSSSGGGSSGGGSGGGGGGGGGGGW